MWVVAVSRRGEFEGIREHLESLSHHRYERITTGTGGEICASPNDSGWPHLALVPEDLNRLRAITQWLHRNLDLSAIVSSGVIEPCMPETTGESSWFIPSMCLRSAGRLDIGSSPVLYEEIAFDRDVQRLITQTLVKRPLEMENRLFGVDRPVTDAETKKWIYANLECQAADEISAELLIMGKRLGTRIGCLKVFGNAKDPVKQLQEAWAALIRP